MGIRNEIIQCHAKVLENNSSVQFFYLLKALQVQLGIVVLFFALAFLAFRLAFLVWTHHDATGRPLCRARVPELFLGRNKDIWYLIFLAQNWEMRDNVDGVNISSKNKQSTSCY